MPNASKKGLPGENGKHSYCPMINLASENKAKSRFYWFSLVETNSMNKSERNNVKAKGYAYKLLAPIIANNK